MQETLARVRLCSEAGADGVFVLGVRTIEQFQEIHQAGRLPMMSNAVPVPAAELVASGVRLINQGHQPFYAMLHSLSNSYRHLVAGGNPADLESPGQSEVQAIALREADYTAWSDSFLKPA
jgi:2-methylisocitrate lyase-like PEP mutase family enzyme